MNQIKTLDRRFSLCVRAREKFKCEYCHGSFSWDPSRLQCSHFHSRRLKSVRFDPENCACMCGNCHQYLDMHPREYAKWKRAKLGEERFEALRLRSQRIVKLDLAEIKALITALEAECVSCCFSSE